MILIHFHFTNTYSNLHSLILCSVVILLNSFIIKNLFYSPVKSAVVREKLHVAKKNYSSRIINFPSRKINSHGGGFIQSYYLWILHRNHCIFPDFYYFCKGGSKRHLGMTFKQT